MPNTFSSVEITLTPALSRGTGRGGKRHLVAYCLLAFSCYARSAFGQAECNGYGGLRGIRVDGQLMPFTTALRAERAGDNAIAGTANERTRNPAFTHADRVQTCTGGLSFGASGAPFTFADRRLPPPIAFVETFTDTAPGTVQVHVHLVANEPFDGQILFMLTAPAAAGMTVAPPPSNGPDHPSTRLVGLHEQLEVDAGGKLSLTATSGGAPPAEPRIALELTSGHLDKAATCDSEFTVRATGDVDHAPLTLSLDPSHPGPCFLGIGGNFRLQNPAADPAIIAYNLAHLRLAWARLAMPLNLWQPDEATDPAQAADAGRLNPQVKAAMEMGRTLAGKHVPMIISVWSAPEWALGPSPYPTRATTRRAATMPDAPNRGRPTTRPLRGRAVKSEKLAALCRSITTYLLYAKAHYGFEPALYSFNESDLGIDVRQTPADQDQLIRTLGPMLQAAGLNTKLLLGDTSDATPTHFIDIALNDPAARPFIGAVSFHSWRGGRDDQLLPWGAAAKQLNVPLLVAEGGTDAAAYAYPAIFEEPWFALDEIALYVRICALDQPASILEWQLTSDYAVLTGWRDNQPLAPTMRFWQLQQLNQTPPDAPAVPIRADSAAVQACAYLDGRRGVGAIHITNAGPARDVAVVGLPAAVRRLRTSVTDARRGMVDGGTVPVEQGTVKIHLDAMTFTTLLLTPK